jgi:ABC-type polysaccharide/polyol phosphate transport system ATPase subunit
VAELVLNRVTVEYPVYSAASVSLRKQLVHLGTGGRISALRGHVATVKALDGVTMRLADGDRLGLVGHNGSGKTTLLRTMAGIFRPVEGTVAVTGRVSTVFGLGAGLEPELTGYENVVRMAMLLGATHAEAERTIPDIESFTELGSFLAMPVRTYSAGMTTRLSFAVATAVHPEILLIDEVLGAGDAGFQAKAHRRMAGFVERASILVLASHAPELLRLFCDRIARLEHGRLVAEGSTAEMLGLPAEDHPGVAAQ